MASEAASTLPPTFGSTSSIFRIPSRKWRAWQGWINFATVWGAALSISGLQAYKRSGLDPVYLALFAILGLYVAIGVIISALKAIRVVMVLCGMLMMVRAWSNWKEGKTDEALLRRILDFVGGETVGGFPGSLPTSFSGIETVEGESGIFVRG